MRSRSLSLVLAATVAAMFVQGCKSDEPTAPPPAGGGTARALIPISYTHIKDSDGGAPNPGNTVTLLFEPESVAQLYVASPTDAIAYRGSYSYAGGRLTLKFNDADFKPDATFPLDTAQETVTLPFKVFSEGAGSSTWKKERLLPQYNFSAIFKAALINEKATVDGAIDRVVGYANAVIEAQGAAKGMVAKTSASSPTLTAVEKMPNGVKVRYDNGPWNYILLYAWPATPSVST